MINNFDILEVESQSMRILAIFEEENLIKESSPSLQIVSL